MFFPQTQGWMRKERKKQLYEDFSWASLQEHIKVELSLKKTVFTLKSLCGETEKSLLPKDVCVLNGLVVWKQMEWGGEMGAKTPGATAAQELWLLQDVSYQTEHFRSASKWTKHFKRNHNSVCMHKFYYSGVNKKAQFHQSLDAALKIWKYLFLYRIFWYGKWNNLFQEKLLLSVYNCIPSLGYITLI